MTESPSDIRAELDRLRNIRTAIEDAILSLATSTDGRTFSLQAPVAGATLRPGGYVVLEVEQGPTLLGQIISADVTLLQAGAVSGLSVGTEEGLQFSGELPIRLLQGTGHVLGSLGSGGLEPAPTGSFKDARMRVATEDEVRPQLAGTRAAGAPLEIGSAVYAGDATPAFLDAAGFNRHTFLCGQSGSGKTFALGVIVERLLVDTELSLVIIDPNSDFVRLAELRPEVEATEAAAGFSEASRGVRVLRPDAGLALRFSDLEPSAQAALLLLDPLADRDEYDLYLRTIEGLAGEQYAISEIGDALVHDLTHEGRQLALRIRNLGLARWPLWGAAGDRSLLDDLESRDWRVLVLDVGTLGSPLEKAVVAQAVLGRLWATRQRREPLLIVVDEAHNVCPQAPEDALTASATDYAVRIAGEGRKFGLYFLVATQRPEKIHTNVLSQCENLLLMRVNSTADLEHIRTVFSHVPASLVQQAAQFRQGESLVAGRIAGDPAIVRFGGRLSAEGGSDVPTSWASRPG
jgi:DNA helicase HerA-like ATPase